CYGISLDGSSSGEHSFIANGCIFEELGKEEDDGGLIYSIGFSSIIKDCIFRYHQMNKINIDPFWRMNKILNEGEEDEQACEWNSASVTFAEKSARIENTTFAGFTYGALRVGKLGKVTLTDTVKFYSNVPVVKSLRLQKSERNIVCNEDYTGQTQLSAESVSFRKTELGGYPGDVSENKWILAKPYTCELFGSIVQSKNYLLYKPYVTNLAAIFNSEGVLISIRGTSLFGCYQLWIDVKENAASVLNAVMPSQKYLLEQYATSWDSDTNATAFIPFNTFIQKGKRMVVSVSIGVTANMSLPVRTPKGQELAADVQPAQDEGIEEEDIEEKKGLSALVIAAIVVVSILVFLSLVIIISALVCYRLNRKNKPELVEVGSVGYTK
ncbi:MAG: hypothetical protein EZS28_025483, partial [Streblomastix strix]